MTRSDASGSEQASAFLRLGISYHGEAPRCSHTKERFVNRTLRTLLIYGLVFVVVAFAAQQFVGAATAPEEVDINKFLSDADEGRIESATVFDTSDRVEYRVEGTDKAEGLADFLVRYPAEFEQSVTDALLEAGVTIDTDPEPPGLFEILISILPWLILIGFMVFIFMQMQGSGNRVMQFGKAKAKTVSKDQPKVTFKDVAGLENAIEELGEEEVHRHVGNEPSGRAFNNRDLMARLFKNNPDGRAEKVEIPFNPMINAGAIMTAALVKSKASYKERLRHVREQWGRLIGREANGSGNVDLPRFNKEMARQVIDGVRGRG